MFISEALSLANQNHLVLFLDIKTIKFTHLGISGKISVR